MRLTNVTHMSLPPGALFSYSPAVRALSERPLPVSFDQRRHVGLGERPGSWMAITVKVPVGTTRDALAEAWHALIDRHGTLRTVFDLDGGGDVLLWDGETEQGQWSTHDVESGIRTRDVLRTVLDASCTPFSAPSHRLCVVYPTADESDPRPVVVIAADHAHVDMWSLLVLARDLLETLDGEEAALGLDEQPRAPRSPVASFADHTSVLEGMPDAPPEVYEAWNDILTAGDGWMPRFPLPLGDVSEPRPEVVEVRDVLDGPELARLAERAKEQGVRVTAIALSVLAAISLEQADAPLRAVFPVHSRHAPLWHDAVGWFITNSVIECAVPDPHACADAVKLALSLGSHPLAPILAPWGGMPQGPGMFAISWLDTRRIPVAVDPQADVQWVSAATMTDGVMIWFVVGDGGLHLRCRYPDTPEARENVGGWIDAVQSGLRAAAV